MSLCACCGISLDGPVALCSHHDADPGHDDWAVTNRIMCDLLHRGIVAARPVRSADPSDELLACAAPCTDESRAACITA